jgi:alpha-ketoglutarate-dependent taurine dioxygenase
MLTRTITDARVWNAESLDGRNAWYYPLPDACWAAFEKIQRDVRQTIQRLRDIRLIEELGAACAQSLEPVHEALETGRGFAIIEGPPHLSPEQAQALYCIVGQGLGRPLAQNVQGTVLYDVRDAGQDVAGGARFSVTNYESSFHTDNSFGSDVVDYVGLLCLKVAKTGGRSQMVSGYAVHNELLKRHGSVLQTLYEPFHVDRRGGVRDGETATVQFPIIRSSGQDLLFRYLRYWIEAGHTKAGRPLTSAQRAALDVLDQVLGQREMRVEFDLQPGQMYFINNRWILHNRTAFEDYPEPERRRHLVRLWLQARSNVA